MPARRPILGSCLLILALSTTGQAQSYDLILRGGQILDGTGNPAFTADVAVTAGEIVAIGDLSAATATRIIRSARCSDEPCSASRYPRSFIAPVSCGNSSNTCSSHSTASSKRPSSAQMPDITNRASRTVSRRPGTE